MEINYNLVSLIKILGFVQGIVFGSYLLIINRRKFKSTTYLGLFILAYTLEFLPPILDELHIFKYYPNLILLPLDFTWLLFPLFYVYIQKVSIFSDYKISYWVLYPGVVSILINIVLFLLPVSEKIIVENSIWYSLFFATGFIYSLWIGCLTIIWIVKHRNEVKNQFSIIKYKELRWAYLFVIMSFAYIIFGLVLIFALLPIFLKENFIVSIVVSLIDVLFLYWVSIRGIQQYNVISLINQPLMVNSTLKKSVSSKAIIEPKIETEMQNLIFQLDKYIQQTEIFKKPELSILDIAKALKLHPRKISNAVNSVCNQNFNAFINQYRINKAKNLIANNTISKLSVEGIGNEVGFKSKSTFHKEFKKQTGTTPFKYNNLLLSKDS